MAHSEYCPSLLDNSLYLDTILQTGSHGFFTKNMITLTCECVNNFCMKMILHCDQYGVCQGFANGTDRIRRCCVKFLPGIEHKGLIDIVQSGEIPLSFWTRFSNGNDFAAIWTSKGVFRISLCSVSNDKIEVVSLNDHMYLSSLATANDCYCYNSVAVVKRIFYLGRSTP